MIGKRSRLRPSWRNSCRGLWHRILQSEELARRDFMSKGRKPISLFLQWYFRLF
jgi:hypothetical protein